MNINEKIKNIYTEFQKARDYYPANEEFCIKSIDNCIDLLKNYIVSANLSTVYQNLEYTDADILETNISDVLKNDLTMDIFKSQSEYELKDYFTGNINQLITGLSKSLDTIHLDHIKSIVKLEEKRLNILLSSLLNFNQLELVEDNLRDTEYPINDMKTLFQENIEGNSDFQDILSLNLLDLYNKLKLLNYEFISFEEYCKSTLPSLNSKFIEETLITKLKDLKATILNKESLGNKAVIISNLICIYHDIANILLKAQYYYKSYIELYNYTYKYLESLLKVNKSYKVL